jgi:hypothetical protein
VATKAIGYALNQSTSCADGSRTDACRSTTTLRSGRSARSWVARTVSYGSDTHAESAAAIFSIIASCWLHRIDSDPYLDEVRRVLPHWPQDRYLELL